jgi:hypothetical protein
MQEKKNIRLIISLLLLIIATVLTAWLMNRSDQDVVDKDLFKTADLKSVDEITLESTNGKTKLEFNGTKWKINDRYDADRDLIDVLFATLQQAAPKRPVATSLRDSISNYLKKAGVKVSLYIDGKKIKTFFAGGNERKTQAYFNDAENNAPYVMVIPGYRVYTSGIFELEANGWRDKRIFNFNWRNFKSLTATFPAQPDQNFKATFIDHYFGIEGITAVDTTKLNDYLDAVSLLTADRFIEKGLDSLLIQRPILIIEVADVADRHFKLSIYPTRKNELARGILGEDQYVVFRQEKFEEIFRKKDYFRKPD